MKSVRRREEVAAQGCRLGIGLLASCAFPWVTLNSTKGGGIS